MNRALKALKRIAIVIGIVVAFSVGLFGAIILSLRSSETTVPDLVGKDRTAAENAITAARLNFRVRATRPVADAKPDTVLIQIPNAGVVVKVGQTVAVDVSRAAREGEKSTSITSETPEKKLENSNVNSNAKESSNVSENKPKRPRNTNVNASANNNRSRSNNSNRADSVNQNSGRSTNSSSNSVNRRSGANVNRAPSNSNANRRVSRPATAPTP
jgi:beta-lactam-binding protein with PASTA domain